MGEPILASAPHPTFRQRTPKPTTNTDHRLKIKVRKNLDATSGMGIDLVGYADDYASYPRADAWLKLVKELEVKAPACIALTTSMVACKAALTAGIRAVAIPDRYTGFQDFGGAHAVAERLEELDIVDLIS